MQSPKWYFNRLKSMSLPEVLWRIKSLFSGYFEQLIIVTGVIPKYDSAFKCDARELKSGFLVPGTLTNEIFSEHKELHQSGLDSIKKADEILQHKFTFFGHKCLDLGDPIAWHCDHNLGKSSPTGLSAYIDYRDVKTAGDCKEVWEPNRHHQLVVLARAFQITKKEKYAHEVIVQMLSWIDDNPYGTGMNWRSPLELSIRVINWVFALELIKKEYLFPESSYRQIIHHIYLHCWDVSRKYSKGSSANNHLVGEAAGVFVAASWLPEMKNAAKWCEQSKKILEQEIHRQTYTDGCTREQALGYEFFVFQFYLICGLIGRWTNNNFPDAYWNTIESMLAFIANLSDGGRQLPMFGDRDDGYVLDLGDSPDDIDTLMNIGAICFGSNEYKFRSQKYTETAYWLFGEEGLSAYDSILPDTKTTMLTSKAFPESGYYLLQSGNMNDQDNISILFDCAELGYGSIAAHGHADALSIMLRVGGVDVLVDPGTYDYFTYPVWRRYFRSTAAHNTVEIDGVNQSELLGPFLWGSRANSECLEWSPGTTDAYIVAQHDGYLRLTDPVLHERKLILAGDSKEITIIDHLKCKGEHDVKLHFHLSEHCSSVNRNSNSVVVQVGKNVVVFNFEKESDLNIVKGQVEPVMGWLSRGYHTKMPIHTIVAALRIKGDSVITTTLTLK